MLLGGQAEKPRGIRYLRRLDDVVKPSDDRCGVRRICAGVKYLVEVKIEVSCFE
jgi:hypothetical protein